MPQQRFGRVEAAALLCTGAVWLATAGLAHARALDYETIYVGCVESRGGNLPIVTHLNPTSQGISGTYVFIEEDGDRIEGRLEGEARGDEGEVHLQWQDLHGSGSLTLRISRDQSSFTGQWRNGDSGPLSNWWGREGVYSMLASQTCVPGDSA